MTHRTKTLNIEEECIFSNIADVDKKRAIHIGSNRGKKIMRLEILVGKI